MSEQIQEQSFQEMQFRIFSLNESNIQDEPMFWSNAYGWGCLELSTLFTLVDGTVSGTSTSLADKETLHLPEGDSEWINENQVKNTIAKFNAKSLYSE